MKLKYVVVLFISSSFFKFNLIYFKVVVSNIYTARHLEFDYVFLYHFTEDRFPTTIKNRLEFPQSIDLKINNNDVLY